MTWASTRARAESIVRSEVWGISTFDAGAGPVYFEIGAADIERDAAWATTVLGEHGVSAGVHVLVTSGGWEQPWFAPIVGALRDLGAVYAATEIWPFDAGRLEAFLRLLPIRVVVGIDGALAESLASRANLAEVLSEVDVVFARTDAQRVLEDAGVRVVPMALLGPALVMGRPGQPGMSYDDAEWSFSDADGELSLTTIGPRRHRVVALALGVKGRCRAETTTIELS